jgi:hypothetical protein
MSRSLEKDINDKCIVSISIWGIKGPQSFQKQRRKRSGFSYIDGTFTQILSFLIVIGGDYENFNQENFQGLTADGFTSGFQPLAGPGANPRRSSLR